MKKRLIFLIPILCVVFNLYAENIPTNGLIGYWPFSGNANDSIGINHGTVNGATLTKDRFGNSNNAYYFDGVNDNISLLFTNDTLHINELSTISFWFKAEEEQNSYAKLLSVPTKLDTWSNPYHHMGISHSTQYGWEYANFNALNICETTTKITEVTTTDWHLYTIVNNNTDLSFYVDGVLMAELSCSYPLLPKGKTMSIGSRSTNSANNGEYYTGIIDDLAIFDRALNQSEILNYFNYSVTSTSDTTSFYVSDIKFKENSSEVFLESIDTLSSNLALDSIVYRYNEFIYKEDFYTDTITFNDTLIIRDTITFTDTLTINDTITINDTVAISVTDTLFIDVTIVDVNTTNIKNTLKIYPNPAKSFINISTGEEYNQMASYSIKMISTTGVTVFDSMITDPYFSIDVNDFEDTGLYLIQLIDSEGQIIDVRKLVLE